MLEKIKARLAQYYDLSTARGVFFSLFDSNKQLLSSNGVLFTDRAMEEVITSLYNWLVVRQDTTVFIGIDIVLDVQQETNPQQITNINTQKYWIYVYSEWSNSSGVILPNTLGILDITHAIHAIKEKTKIWGQAQIYSFTTDRILIEKS